MRSSHPAPSAALAHRRSPVQPDRVRPGDEVEVWCRSLGRWSHGFVALELGSDGWRVLRRSDDSPLPLPFPRPEVRRAP